MTTVLYKTHKDLQLLPLAVVSAVLCGGVGASTVACVAAAAFSSAFRRLSGERSGCFLSDPVGDLHPDLETAKETAFQSAVWEQSRVPEPLNIQHVQLMKSLLMSRGEMKKVASDTYMPTGLTASADGETVCSRSEL